VKSNKFLFRLRETKELILSETEAVDPTFDHLTNLKSLVLTEAKGYENRHIFTSLGRLEYLKLDFCHGFRVDRVLIESGLTNLKKVRTLSLRDISLPKTVYEQFKFMDCLDDLDVEQTLHFKVRQDYFLIVATGRAIRKVNISTRRSANRTACVDDESSTHFVGVKDLNVTGWVISMKFFEPLLGCGLKKVWVSKDPQVVKISDAEKIMLKECGVKVKTTW
jgi:hypothetical protein